MSDTILLVEDDPGSRDLIGTLLAARGYALDCAADGFLGLRLLSERRHNIVLIDYHLPEMDGYALARLMREVVGAQGQVRLIGITADRHGLASRRGADALFDAILVKPLEPGLLYATLDRLLREPEAPPASVSTIGPAEALWRRRGLPGRPRAVLYPDLGAEATAAVGHAFMPGPLSDADVILIGDASGVMQHQALEPGSRGHLLPRFDLTGQRGAVCDGSFRVDDPAAWTALASTCSAFSARRAALAADVRESDEPSHRLLSWFYVGARSLPLSAAQNEASATVAGLSRCAAIAAILNLTERGLVACEPTGDGLAVSLTPAGLSTATAGLRSTSRTTERRDPNPIRDAARASQLRDAIGSAALDRLTEDLHVRLEGAFGPGGTRQTIVEEAHTLIAAAGSLGYVQLEAACRALEDAIRSGAEETAALAQVRLEIKKISALRISA